jgi:protein-S-isoprenylcysteine O-methyltransferase Ste14
MSVCRVRLILWLFLTGTTLIAGLLTDSLLHTRPFPIWVRILGLVGMLVAHFPLKRTGRLLGLKGKPEVWGCTTRLITDDLYQCVRHPHHVFIGIFMASLGLAIGHIGSFLFITIPQWVWILGFLFLVEERELAEKFGSDYETYRRGVPMLIGRPGCLFKVLTTPLEES